ncbi:hypothetical protein ACWD04_19645 [Streptomyces sp. NPDC002911]
MHDEPSAESPAMTPGCAVTPGGERRLRRTGRTRFAQPSASGDFARRRSLDEERGQLAAVFPDDMVEKRYEVGAGVLVR